MEFIDNPVIRNWALQLLVMAFFVAGLVGFAVGAGLYFYSQRTLRLFDTSNRWVSMRNAAKPLEIPRNTAPLVQKYRRWIALFFIAGAAFSLIVIATKYDQSAVIMGLNMGDMRAPIAGWIVDSARWLLIVGNLAAIAVGIMLGFFPESLATLESGGSKWYSERKLIKGADRMYLPLDKWVAAFPRTTGVIFMLTTLILMGNLGFMWFGLH